MDTSVNSRLKIMLISAANNPHTVKWANGFESLGHEVHLVYLPNHRPAAQKIHSNVILHELKFGGGVGYYLNALYLKAIVAKVSPDVINTHYATGYGTLSRLAKIKKNILTVWGSDVYAFPKKSFFHKLILRKNLKSAYIITSASHCMITELTRLYPSTKLDTREIPFGVDLNEFSKNRYSDRVQISKKSKLSIGTVKTLKSIYRIDTIIDAANLLIKDKDISNKYELEFNIYGDGNLKSELQNKINTLGLDETVFLRGSIPIVDVPKVLSDMDIFCVASQHESFGVAVVEAMAMSLPIVASNVDGFKEIIGDSGAGLLFDPGNARDMKEALRRQIILDEESRRRNIDQGLQRVRSFYDWRNNLNDMILIFRKTIGSPSK